MRASIVVLLLATTAHAETTDFTPQMRAMFRIAACGSQDDIPKRYPKGTVNAHCRDMASVYASYKKQWVDIAKPFIADLRPQDIPNTVVYPFGGGDLSSALTVFPDATDLTTLSLEAAGDIRDVEKISKEQLVYDLGAIAGDLKRLYYAAHSTTKSLQLASHSVLPGTIMLALAGLTVHDMEPVSMRYFELDADGGVRYLSDVELEHRAAELVKQRKARKKSKHFWSEQESAFGNVEIQYRPKADPNAPLRTYRHIVMNLDDAHLTADDRVLKHLEKKGKVAVMTKAASFLLWYDDFTKIRGYLIDHLAWMISDASGIPPSYAEPAGFEQTTYGDFTGPYFVIDEKNTRAEFVKLWKDQPHRDLPFRFGYPDAEKHNHLMITRPKPRAR